MLKYDEEGITKPFYDLGCGERIVTDMAWVMEHFMDFDPSQETDVCHTHAQVRQNRSNGDLQCGSGRSQTKHKNDNFGTVR